MRLYYQPSNQMPPAGILLLLAGGLAAAIPLAFAYSYITWFWPFTLIFLFLGFGLGLGLVLARLVRRGKLRSPREVGHLALLVGLAALYLHWSVYLTLRASASNLGRQDRVRTSARFRPNLWVRLLSNPGQLVERVRLLPGLSIDDQPVLSRWYLLLMWGAEVVAIVGLARSEARSQAQEPFSEATGTWATSEILLRPVNHVRDPAAMRKALEAGDFQALVAIPTKSDVHQMLKRPPGSFARLRLYSAPGDPGCRHLTVENFIGQRRKGVASFGVTVVVERLWLSPTAYQELKSRFGVLYLS